MRLYFSLMFLLIATALLGQNWQTVNNTNHVYDIEKNGDSLYFSTWGGVVEIDGVDTYNHLQNSTQTKHWTTADALVSNDIRNISRIDFSESLWFGSSNDGISIFSPEGSLNLGLDLGLPSNRINKIIELESKILVATSQGLAVFYYLPGVSFPLMLNRYNTLNTAGALSNDNITDMLITEDNLLFMANDAGIDYVHVDSLEVSGAWKSLLDDSPLPIGGSYLLSASPDKLAISTGGRLYTISLPLDVDNWEIYTLEHGVLGPQISALCISAVNDIWLAYGSWNENLLRYSSTVDTLLTRIKSDGSYTHYPKNTAGLGYNHISKIKEFGSDIYICTWGDGIARFRAEAWDYYYPDSIGFPKITAAKADNSNALWFVSGNIGDQLVRKGTLGVSKFFENHWTSFKTTDSPLHSDNILALEIDGRNRKWFGAWDASYASTGWFNGVSILDDENGTWHRISKWGIANWDEMNQDWGAWIPGSPRLQGNTIGGIMKDKYNNMFVLCYDDGVTVLDADDEHLADFELYGTTIQRVTCAHHNGRQYFFGTEYDNGLSIWNNDSIPETNGSHWLTQIPPDLKSGTIYGIASTETPYEGWQHFVASGAGLFMWDETNWYKYDTYIKRYKYNFSTNNWVNDTLYYADEERLFGSINTIPNSIYGDPFGRIWIGSQDNGISMYDPARERFTNYYQGNAPLLSNRIISLGYDPLNGRLLIGTPEGLNTLLIGRTVKPDSNLGNVKAYPNPFKPTGNNTVQIVNLPNDTMPNGINQCSIFSASGALIITLEETPFSRFEWDGKNKSGKLVSSGIYFFSITDDKGNTKTGKIAIIH